MASKPSKAHVAQLKRLGFRIEQIGTDPPYWKRGDFVLDFDPSAAPRDRWIGTESDTGFPVCGSTPRVVLQRMAAKLLKFAANDLRQAGRLRSWLAN